LPKRDVLSFYSEPWVSVLRVAERLAFTSYILNGMLFSSNRYLITPFSA
jgi:hypothetical protein